MLYFLVTSNRSGGFHAQCPSLDYEFNADSLADLHGSILTMVEAHYSEGERPAMADIKLVFSQA